MLSKVLIGLLAILWGTINLGVKIDWTVFYWGVAIFGVVYLFELLYGPVSARLVRRSADQ